MRKEISALLAAKEQLNEAIKIFFNEGSGISTHSLVANAHEILRKQLRLKDPNSMILLDEIPKRVEGNVKDKLLKFIPKAKNAFKHANPGQVIKFDSEINKIWIWDACLMYLKITTKITREMLCFMMWLYTNHPEYLNEAYASLFKPYKMRADMTKKEFLELIYVTEISKIILEE